MENSYSRSLKKMSKKSDKCDGVVTRQNRKNPDEKSAIDSVACTYTASRWIQRMKIDEDGDFRFRGTNESDHNTVTIAVNVEDVQRNSQQRKTMWNVKASDEKFSLLRFKLATTITESNAIMSNNTSDISERYGKWENLLYKNAISSIEKTTYK